LGNGRLLGVNMVFNEPPDPLSGKGKHHEAAASSKINSGSTIQPNPMELMNRFSTLYGTILKLSPENIKQKWEGISPRIKVIFGRIASKTQTTDDISTLIFYIQVIEEDIALSKPEPVVETKPKQLVVMSPAPIQIPVPATPTIVPSSAKPSYKGKGKTYKLTPYEERCRQTLLALGTKSANEWDVVGSGYDEQGTACQLCGHSPIKNIYVIEKVKGDNIGTKLEIGSECVLNYLGIPMAVADFNLTHNKDKGFIKKMDKLLEILKGD